jgi:hypothetical protein
VESTAEGDHRAPATGGWKLDCDPVKKRLFVCTSNLCRSPVAEAVFNDLARERGLEWRAESAGLSALEGERLPEDVEAPRWGRSGSTRASTVRGRRSAG